LLPINSPIVVIVSVQDNAQYVIKRLTHLMRIRLAAEQISNRKQRPSVDTG